jgi:methyl coenzyme M reductase beta subunit
VYPTQDVYADAAASSNEQDSEDDDYTKLKKLQRKEMISSIDDSVVNRAVAGVRADEASLPGGFKWESGVDMEPWAVDAAGGLTACVCVCVYVCVCV